MPSNVANDSKDGRMESFEVTSCVILFMGSKFDKMRCEMAIIIECSDFLERATDGERFLLDSLRTSPLSDDWTVFFQPHINGFKPDFVLANRYFGVIIIEVKDWNLDSPRYASSGQILGENGEWVTCNPAEQVKDYKNLIINECCVDTYRRLEEKHGKTAYGII